MFDEHVPSNETLWRSRVSIEIDDLYRNSNLHNCFDFQFSVDLNSLRKKKHTSKNKNANDGKFTKKKNILPVSFVLKHEDTTLYERSYGILTTS